SGIAISINIFALISLSFYSKINKTQQLAEVAFANLNNIFQATDSDFSSLAYDQYRYQLENNPIYRTWTGLTPLPLPDKSITTIPALPV
ncbi:hypothetical protein ACO1NI_13830, partial [Staphylococcus aureus]